MANIKLTILRVSPGTYNLQLADPENSSRQRNYNGHTEPQLIAKLEDLLSLSSADVETFKASFEGSSKIIKFHPVSEATFASLFG